MGAARRDAGQTFIADAITIEAFECGHGELEHGSEGERNDDKKDYNAKVDSWSVTISVNFAVTLDTRLKCIRTKFAAFAAEIIMQRRFVKMSLRSSQVKPLMTIYSVVKRRKPFVFKAPGKVSCAPVPNGEGPGEGECSVLDWRVGDLAVNCDGRHHFIYPIRRLV